MSKSYQRNGPDVVFKDFSIHLPANRPLGGPHVIDTRQSGGYVDTCQYTIADAIVTLLCKYNAEALNAFLDGSRPYFVLQRRTSDTSTIDADLKQAGSVKLTRIDLMRDGRVVHVRHSVAELNDTRLAFQIEDDGQWTPLVHYNVSQGCRHRSTNVMASSSQLAKIILEGKLWKCPKGMRMGWSDNNANMSLQTYMQWRRTFDLENEHH